MDYLLQVENLRKDYGSFRAVDDISFNIPPGICFGLLGPNGAGKTTTIEIIEGITAPTAGKVRYKGKARDSSFTHQCGIQFQSTALQDYLTVREVLTLFASFYPQPLGIDEMIDWCDLGEFAHREANKLSGGQKQRLLLALALVNDPILVFLDEPTTGLDPQSRRRFWQLIDDIKSRGKTIILTTHYMDEAELLCDDLVIMDHGRIVDQGSPRQLLDRHLPHKRVCIRPQNGNINTGILNGEPSWRGDELEIVTDSVESVLQDLLAQQIDLTTLRVRNPTLEDLFIKLTGHQLRD